MVTSSFLTNNYINFVVFWYLGVYGLRVCLYSSVFFFIFSQFELGIQISFFLIFDR
jgi:hypothetical protein